MPHNADAFRYGLLVGLRHEGCTEKLAYAILDDLEETQYDAAAFRASRLEKTAKFMGAVKGLLGGAKGFTQGLTGVGAQGIKKTIRGGAAAPAGFRTGARANKWLGRHPVAAGAAGAGGLMLGNRVINGARASQGDVEGLQKRQGEVEGYLNDPGQRVQEMYQLMQLMQGRRGMGYGY